MEYSAVFCPNSGWGIFNRNSGEISSGIDTLEAAREKGITHRDLKPANTLVDLTSAGGTTRGLQGGIAAKGAVLFQIQKSFAVGLIANQALKYKNATRFGLLRVVF